MPIPGIAQPDRLEIEYGLRLRRFDGQFAFALPWYQDEETVHLGMASKPIIRRKRWRRCMPIWTPAASCISLKP